MTGWVVRNFKGIAPRITPRLLADNQAQSAANVVLKHGSLYPLGANSAVMTLPKTGPILSIHRFGQDVASDTQYWFHWAAEVDVVRGPIFGDTQERTYYTDGVKPKITDNSIALAGGTSYPMAAYDLGVPAPTAAPGATVSGTPTYASSVPETRVYVVTFKTTWSEEGAPSNASAQVDVQVGEDVDLTLPAIPSGAYSFATKRIYRSVPGSTGTPYLFVAEVSAATTTYKDSILADALGEQLGSLEYEMPPATMVGLTGGPNGVMAGFKGQDVYFCEPYKPHAWPSSYSLTVDSSVVGIGVFDTSWLILTKTTPFLISGSDPSNYTMVKSELNQACVSKRSIVSAAGGVIYASPDGLYLVSGGGVKNLTEGIYTRKEWAALGPDTLRGYFYDNCYIGFYGGTVGFVLDLVTLELTPLNWYASAGYWDAIRNALFLVTGSTGLVKFDAGAALTMTWKSKPFYSASPVNLGVARVEATAYPVTLNVYAAEVPNATAIVADLTAKGIAGLTAPTSTSIKYSVSVASNAVFRLPAGFKSKVWEFEISGTGEVTSAGFAQSVDELKTG